MKKLLPLLLAVLVAACANIAKVEGEQLVNQRMAIQLAEAWNKVSVPGDSQPYERWTQEGLSLDELRLWAGIRPGQPLMTLPPGNVPAGQKAPRVPTYAAGMAPDQLVSLFESVYSADGSLVSVTRVEPAQFAGERGVRFEFTVVRKRNDLQMSGVGWVSVRKDELFAASFVAPRLAFYPRLLPKAEAVARSAQIRG
ncbi:hypothetical protein PE066_01270 [Ramlibacter tataouinensis]|uniref:hypothetical protein n=1 Tax=Ramlibacter tataouinensis TaxID=94132 RepID=UPI0022F3AD06|nr:hypothetical protein [Ramlibacter tataouinensis]WBY02192.1 hypothetical protein PE066_01270 [Ramlibacter tataouinensis]